MALILPLFSPCSCVEVKGRFTAWKINVELTILRFKLGSPIHELKVISTYWWFPLIDFQLKKVPCWPSTFISWVGLAARPYANPAWILSTWIVYTWDIQPSSVSHGEARLDVKVGDHARSYPLQRSSNKRSRPKQCQTEPNLLSWRVLHEWLSSSNSQFEHVAWLPTPSNTNTKKQRAVSFPKPVPLAKNQECEALPKDCLALTMCFSKKQHQKSKPRGF